MNYNTKTKFHHSKIFSDFIYPYHNLDASETLYTKLKPYFRTLKYNYSYYMSLFNILSIQSVSRESFNTVLIFELLRQCGWIWYLRVIILGLNYLPVKGHVYTGYYIRVRKICSESKWSSVTQATERLMRANKK